MKRKSDLTVQDILDNLGEALVEEYSEWTGTPHEVDQALSDLKELIEGCVPREIKKQNSTGVIDRMTADQIIYNRGFHSARQEMLEAIAGLFK